MPSTLFDTSIATEAGQQIPARTGPDDVLQPGSIIGFVRGDGTFVGVSPSDLFPTAALATLDSTQYSTWTSLFTAINAGIAALTTAIEGPVNAADVSVDSTALTTLTASPGAAIATGQDLAVAINAWIAQLAAGDVGGAVTSDQSGASYPITVDASTLLAGKASLAVLVPTASDGDTLTIKLPAPSASQGLVTDILIIQGGEGQTPVVTLEYGAGPSTVTVANPFGLGAQPNTVQVYQASPLNAGALLWQAIRLPGQESVAAAPGPWIDSSASGETLKTYLAADRVFFADATAVVDSSVSVVAGALPSDQWPTSDVRVHNVAMTNDAGVTNVDIVGYLTIAAADGTVTLGSDTSFIGAVNAWTEGSSFRITRP